MELFFDLLLPCFSGQKGIWTSNVDETFHFVVLFLLRFSTCISCIVSNGGCYKEKPKCFNSSLCGFAFLLAPEDVFDVLSVGIIFLFVVVLGTNLQIYKTLAVMQNLCESIGTKAYLACVWWVGVSLGGPEYFFLSRESCTNRVCASALYGLADDIIHKVYLKCD